MRKAKRTPASRSNVVSRVAPVELIVDSPHDDNDEVGQRQPRLNETDAGPTRKLNSDSSPYIGTLGTGDVYLAGNAWRGWLSNDVKQNFANLTCACSDRVALFVLYCVDLSVGVQGKNHWFRVHSLSSLPGPLDRSVCLSGQTGIVTVPR